MSFPPAPPMDDERPPRVAWGMWKRFLIAGAAIVLLSGGATAAIALTRLNNIAHEVFPSGSQIHVASGVVEKAYSGEPQTFLIIGSDRRIGSRDAYDRNNPPHSDTLLLVRLDPNEGQTSVLSIPRDLLTTITTRSGHTYYPRKVNAAYTIGSLEGGSDRGEELTTETIKRLLHVKINQVIDVTFKGFIRVVDTLGCVYVNVDHRYLHTYEDTESENYSAINLQPGYQKLCYENALSYVRYRHGDSDFVRVARQQDFMRGLREQISVSNLTSQIDKVSKEVGKAVTSTFKPSAGQLIELAQLAAFSQQKPLRQVKFQVDSASAMIGGESYVTSSPELIKATVRDFLHGHEQVDLPVVPKQHSHHGHSHSHSHSTQPSAASLDLFSTIGGPGEAMAVTTAPNIPFPLKYPTLQMGSGVPQEVHAYTLKDQHGHVHHAYVAVWQENTLGGYYDVEGMDWVNIPLFAHARVQEIDGRKYLLVDDGAHIHDIGWRVGKVIYFVSNTLLEDLSNAQMIAIARSTQALH